MASRACARVGALRPHTRAYSDIHAFTHTHTHTHTCARMRMRAYAHACAVDLSGDANAHEFLVGFARIYKETHPGAGPPPAPAVMGHQPVSTTDGAAMSAPASASASSSSLPSPYSAYTGSSSAASSPPHSAFSAASAPPYSAVSAASATALSASGVQTGANNSTLPPHAAASRAEVAALPSAQDSQAGQMKHDATEGHTAAHRADLSESTAGSAGGAGGAGGSVPGAHAFGAGGVGTGTSDASGGMQDAGSGGAEGLNHSRGLPPWFVNETHDWALEGDSRRTRKRLCSHRRRRAHAFEQRGWAARANSET